MENFSFIICFYGRHRVGKSLGAVSFCNIIDKTFADNLEKRVVYDSSALLSAFQELREKKTKGGGIVIDECGTGDLSSQRWYEQMAKLVSAQMQAVGYLNPLICFVAPNFSFLNSVSRKLSQGVFEVSRKHNKYSIIKPFWIDNQTPWQKEPWRRYPIFCEKRNGVPSSVYKISKIKIGLPPVDIQARYELHSQRYKDKLLEDSRVEITSFEKNKATKATKLDISFLNKIATDVYHDLDAYLFDRGSHKGRVDANIIRMNHSLSVSNSKTVKSLVEKMVQAKRKR